MDQQIFILYLQNADQIIKIKNPFFLLNYKTENRMECSAFECMRPVFTMIALLNSNLNQMSFPLFACKVEIMDVVSGS